MTTAFPGTIRELGDTGRTVADPDADVRGRAVVDRGGHELGHVEDLLVDDCAQRVLFLRVAQGGFLGFGATHYLIPVEAVTAVGRDRVVVDGRSDPAGSVAAYDPDLAPVPAYYGNAYGWWGAPPSWGAPLR